MKYPQRMARPRQWAKKFSNVHKHLKSAVASYRYRSNKRMNNMAMAKQSKYKNKALHYQLGYGKYRLKPTRVYKGGKKRSTYGGRPVWRKGFKGFYHTGFTK